MKNMESKIKDFQDLEVWKRGRSLVRDIYQITANFPKEETYVLTSQMRRAAVSIPCNIAEGFNRLHSREYRQFLFYSRGSCGELLTQIILSGDLGYLDAERGTKVKGTLDEQSRMLMALIKRL